MLGQCVLLVWCCLANNLLKLVAIHPVLQRKAASAGAQTTRDCKENGRQMITMAFLEEGGYFDVPIQVKVTPGSHLVAYVVITSRYNLPVQNFCCLM